jgi:hypothetical protein
MATKKVKAARAKFARHARAKNKVDALEPRGPAKRSQPGASGCSNAVTVRASAAAAAGQRAG